ncbi:MAG: hypothetical protein ACQXXL_01495 [Candidatus Methanosuratincola sp.]
MGDLKGVWQNLVLFFLIAFGFSWAFWIPQALASMGIFTAAPWLREFLFSPYNPAAFGPLVGAVVLTYTEGGIARVASLLRKITKYRIGWWYLPVFLVSPAIMGLALLMAVLSGDPLPDRCFFRSNNAPIRLCLYLPPRRSVAGGVRLEGVCARGPAAEVERIHI